MRRPLLVGLLVALAAALVAAAAGGQATSASQSITPSGVGAVKLGATYRSLRRHHLVGRIRQGCELSGPSARSAPLRRPLKGTVDFTRSLPRRARNISVRGGATARGVGIGATIRRIKAAYPNAKVDHSTDSTFGITLVKVPKNGGGRLEFAVDTGTHKVTTIGVPYIAFCE